VCLISPFSTPFVILQNIGLPLYYSRFSQISSFPFRFNSQLSMGWYQSPPGWKLEITVAQRKKEAKVEKQIQRQKQR
jgi:hypothetical protein